jgi:aminoglycoside 2'-N-acetyltransferase I
MWRIERFTTNEASRHTLRSIRMLLDRAFEGEFTDDDWAHSVGGWHVVADDGGSIVSHASLVARSIEIGGVPFRAGYVEAVATEPASRGLGLGTAVMREVAEVIATHHELGALSTGEHHFYERLGWERWQGPTHVRDGERLIRTPDEDDGIMVLRFGPSAGVDLDGEIACEARVGDDW